MEWTLQIFSKENQQIENRKQLIEIFLKLLLTVSKQQTRKRYVDFIFQLIEIFDMEFKQIQIYQNQFPIRYTIKSLCDNQILFTVP